MHQKTKKFLLISSIAASLLWCGWQVFQPNRPTAAALSGRQDIYQYGDASSDGIGKFYMGREISSMIEGHGAIRWLERADREASEKPDIVIAEMHLKPDTVVADIGAGSGYFTFRIAPQIQQGKIYAVEIGKDMLDFLNTKKAEMGATNVVVHEGLPSDTQLPGNTIDIAFMVDAYHEFSHPREMMESIVQALKPGGRVVFVEYREKNRTFRSNRCIK